jgi:hypothetical protein
MMRTRTRLQANQARRQLRKKRRYLIAPKLPAQNHPPSRIDAVHLQYVLR